MLLEYESAATQRRAKLWRLALAATQGQLAFLTLALFLSVFFIPKIIREVQWQTLTGAQRVVVWMGHVGLLHVLSWVTTLIALLVLHRMVRGRSGWPMLLVYVVPHLALLGTYETAALLVGATTITVSQSNNGATMFMVNSVYLRLGLYALLSAPLLMIAYNLIDHLANRRRKQ